MYNEAGANPPCRPREMDGGTQTSHTYTNRDEYIDMCGGGYMKIESWIVINMYHGTRANPPRHPRTAVHKQAVRISAGMRI